MNEGTKYFAIYLNISNFFNNVVIEFIALSDFYYFKIIFLSCRK